VLGFEDHDHLFKAVIFLGQLSEASFLIPDWHQSIDQFLYKPSPVIP
jgi:hypothetical protein